jgi:hypothetical protein
MIGFAFAGSDFRSSPESRNDRTTSRKGNAKSEKQDK